MKNIKYLVIALIGLLVVSSCDQNDTEGTIYKAKNDEASFALTSSSYTFGEFDPDQYEVSVKRGNAQGAATLPVTIVDPTGFFSVSEVAFADGSYEALVAITFNRSNLTPGTNYRFTMTLPDNPINERTITHSVTIMRDYVWREYVRGTFKSTFAAGSSFPSSEWEQVMEKADGAEAYRLVDIYATGYHISFAVDEDGSITPFVALNSNGLYPFVTGYDHPSYGMTTFQIDADPAYTYFDSANKIVCLNGAFTVSAGSFGWFDEIFVW